MSKLYLQKGRPPQTGQVFVQKRSPPPIAQNVGQEAAVRARGRKAGLAGRETTRSIAAVSRAPSSGFRRRMAAPVGPRILSEYQSGLDEPTETSSAISRLYDAAQVPGAVR